MANNDLDFTVLIKTVRDGLVGNVPFLGSFYSACNGAYADKKLEELANEVEKANIKIKDIESFIQSEKGWLMLKKIMDESISSTNDKIKLFVKVLEGAIQQNNDFGTEYHRVMIDTLSKMTDTEIMILALIFKYYEDVEELNRYDKFSDDKHYVITVIDDLEPEVRRAEDDKKVYFGKYVKDKIGQIIYSNMGFIINRLKNHGLLEDVGNWDASKKTSILAEALYNYIRQFAEQMQTITE